MSGGRVDNDPCRRRRLTEKHETVGRGFDLPCNVFELVRLIIPVRLIAVAAPVTTIAMSKEVLCPSNTVPMINFGWVGNPKPTSSPACHVIMEVILTRFFGPISSN